MKKVIFIGGLYNIVFALFHLGFWQIWQWDSELKKLTMSNSGIMQILNIQMIYYLIFTAVICFAFPAELQSTKLGKWFLAGTSAFWFFRTIEQFVFFPPVIPGMFIFPLVFLMGFILFLIPLFPKNRPIPS